MPIQRFSQGFKDISLSFKRHPVTNDILALNNEDAIKRSVQNLIRIQLGEVFFNDLLDISKNHDREFFLAEIHNVNNKRLQSKEFQRTPCFIVSTCQIATNEVI